MKWKDRKRSSNIEDRRGEKRKLRNAGNNVPLFETLTPKYKSKFNSVNVIGNRFDDPVRGKKPPKKKTTNTKRKKPLSSKRFKKG